jgi:hypothetical protein
MGELCFVNDSHVDGLMKFEASCRDDKQVWKYDADKHVPSSTTTTAPGNRPAERYEVAGDILPS